jgi:catecholate siderophore receptor
MMASSSDSQLSPRAGLIYKPSESVSFYASYSKSFLPRSGDQFLSLTLSSQALDAEEFENKEVGVKWNVNDSLSVTAAAFEVERENGTAQDPNNPEASILTGTETTGFEVQVVGMLTEAWSINAGYSNLDGEEMGRVVDGVVANRDLAQLPEHMLTVWNQYTINDAWEVALGVIHQSEQYATLSNTTELPNFTRVDAAVYYTYSDDLRIQLNVENLFDEEYFPSAHNDNNISTGEPLNARVSVQYQF